MHIMGSDMNLMTYTKVEVFMEKGVCGRPQTAGVNSRRGATKKREISRTFFSTNLHFLVEFLPLPARLQ